MTNRVLTSGCIVAVVAAVALAAAPVAGQAPAAKPATAAQAVRPGMPTPADGAKATRTPWGDPDISRASGRATPRSASRASVPRSSANRAVLYRRRVRAKPPRPTPSGATRASTPSARSETTARGKRSPTARPRSSSSLKTARRPRSREQAQKRAAPRDRGTFGEGPFDDQLDFTLYDRCITRGIVGSVLPVVYGNGNRIMQAPGMVVISYEMVHDTRVIHTDGRPHIGSKIRQYLGDSRGHWEGNTLVIETTNLTDQTSIGGATATACATAPT